MNLLENSLKYKCICLADAIAKEELKELFGNHLCICG